MSPSRRLGVVALMVLAATSACAGGDGDGSARVTVPRLTTTTLAPPVFPLTGQHAPDLDSVTRPALSARLEVPEPGQLPGGLEGADIAFEDVVSREKTGFLAVFHADDPVRLGPLGQVQPDDPLLVVSFGGLFAYAGGSPEVMRTLRGLPIIDVSPEQAPQAYPVKDGKKSHITSAVALRENTPVAAVPPLPFFAFRGDSDAVSSPGAADVTRLTVRPGTTASPSFVWDAANSRWLLEDGGQPRLVGRRQITVDNVVVQLVPYAANGPQLVGAGDVVYATGGKLVRGRWERPKPGGRTRWLDGSGADMRLRTGRTWVVVAPAISLVETEPAGLVPPPTAPPPTQAPPPSTAPPRP